MKFILIGLHGSGKHEIAHMLDSMGVKYGKNFTSFNFDGVNKKHIYNGEDFEIYENQDITDIFENNAYIYIHEHQDPNIQNSYRYFEGLSKYTYDNNDVFIMSPDQFLSISVSNLPEDAVYVWLDNTKTNRQNRCKIERRSYDFHERETLEKNDIKEFVKVLYNISNTNILYFTNEEPCRVASIIYSIHKHPDLLSTFIENYN